jgi:hypothetical protein
LISDSDDGSSSVSDSDISESNWKWEMASS